MQKTSFAVEPRLGANFPGCLSWSINPKRPVVRRTSFTAKVTTDFTTDIIPPPKHVNSDTGDRKRPFSSVKETKEEEKRKNDEEDND